ncbi:DNA polymerase III subunit gamma/tau [Candidatus Saccharibacteria bacterium]|nr:DNA polymerase III subunit gamma/tau [Candidatus Saccharibacteria bacterium]
MTKALYRKYRPKTLKEVVGQPQVTNVLAKSLEQGRISHAYLFVGPRGTGKTSVARILAHEINGFKYEIEDDYVDIIEIDGASNRGIDNIRELREKALIAPTSGKYKVYIIDEVHMLTKEAFNALLKILEEPPKHVVFIMATTDAYKVPVTITSRAQVYTFELSDQKTMFDYLKSVADKEKIKIDDDALEIIVKRGGGSFRDSLSLLDQISTLSDEKITKELVISAMGLPEDEKIKALLNKYLSQDVVKITTLLKELLASGVKPETLAEELISNILEDPKAEYLDLLSRLPDVKSPFPEAKLLVALTANARVAENAFFKKHQRFVRSESYIPDGAEKAVRRTDFPGRPVYDDEDEQVASKKGVSDRTRASVDNTNFNWEEFLSRVKEANDAIYMQLLKTEYKYNNNTLTIIAKKRIVKTILERDNNKKILIDNGNGIKIEILMNEQDAPKDETLAKISDIMGGEVKNDGGENPF